MSREPMSAEEFAAEMERLLNAWDPKKDELEDLERLLDNDELQAEPLFSPQGRVALRAAIEARRG